ncbi:GNAT family N-acetyltransferase [Lacibacter sp.]|uniref:GNAT family N-acetyltransferase n=1 Tax=Lacibacter sp. TaxID=1915409 RepID=UPI002B4B1419|nr:GNAT family N-acetyltransferase [Lacibacter sp.]HLP39838.1 GNAT family N-acetyltransferase [Lacibacter sp.]
MLPAVSFLLKQCCRSMIYYQHFYPEEVSPQLLDAYLSKGWYRIHQMLITTDLIAKEDEFFAVFWLRYRLKDYQHSKKSRKLLRACEQFSCNIEPLQFTDELEELFTKYRQELDFDISDSARAYLMGDRTENVFNTQLLTLRYNGQLIAAGCYDEAGTSLTGILSIYDPAFKKYSLGKVLLLKKLEEAIRLQKTYFYPGYISLHTSKFDYKLFPDKEATEVYNRLTDAWQPYVSSNLQELYDAMLMEFLKEQQG